MVSRTKKLSLQLIAFASALVVMLASFAVLPRIEAHAAGTDLYVGYSGRNNNFSTVQAAVDKAASLNPSSESTRVTIHIAPGTYRQQVIVQTPYVSFVNDEPQNGDVVLTWYYGIGYKYYSANSKGYYVNIYRGQKYVLVRNMIPGTRTSGTRNKKKRPNSNGWTSIVHAISGKEIAVGFIKEAGGGLMFKQNLSLLEFMRINLC